jgi:two-component system, NarL family, invasion response regulator UvrY
MSQKIRVGLVDDHHLIRQALGELITLFNDYTICLDAGDGTELTGMLDKNNLPEIVLIDIQMPGMDGFKTTAWLKEHYPEIKVLALTCHYDEFKIIRMLKMGARGYLLKDIRKEELKKALRSVVKDGYYYSDLVTATIIHNINNEAKNDFNEREMDFLKLVCTELTYQEIAGKMHLSVHTIDGYRERMFERLHAKTRVGLVLYAIRNGIIDLAETS